MHFNTSMSSVTRRKSAGDNHSTTVSEVIHDVADTTREVAAKVVQSFTVTWHEIEEWQKDNEYIHAGYRR